METKEQSRERARIWYQNNKQRVRDRQLKNKDVMSAYSKKYFQENKTRLYANRNRRIKTIPWVRTFYTIASRCGGHEYYKKKGIKAMIKISELKTLWFRDKGYLLKYPSIDRIDRNGNYTFENCQYIELRDNLARRGVITRKYD
jgi:hypothetical protein